MAKTNLFKWRHYESEIIHLCVRWYLRYALGYRDLEEIMRERNLTVDHTTIYRWVQAYAPELEKRIRPHLRLTNNGSIAKNILTTFNSSAERVVATASCMVSEFCNVTVQVGPEGYLELIDIFNQAANLRLC